MSNHKSASDFLGKYYPGIKRMLHENRIKNFRKLVREEEEEYKKNYGAHFQ